MRDKTAMNNKLLFQINIQMFHAFHLLCRMHNAYIKELSILGIFIMFWSGIIHNHTIVKFNGKFCIIYVIMYIAYITHMISLFIRSLWVQYKFWFIFICFGTIALDVLRFYKKLFITLINQQSKRGPLMWERTWEWF